MITIGLICILITVGRCWIAVRNRPHRDVRPKLPSGETIFYGLLLLFGCALIVIRAVVWILVNMP